ncbi:MAG: hypothetical protein ABH824_01815 [Nanoarchaeota archaeon]|nr:hypothetical protein [Nanoarchaeota archaeon]MBU1631808.1 hypothetical protein [Nanoarchaeota archaeon]MBU1876600.1 hypothetical protein [Nanoarchaeota archaeon]
MGKGYNLDDNIIIINRKLTELDIFVNDFLDILKRHCDYLIVSGFVSISTGRTRGTEDVDVLVPVMTRDTFEKLFVDLQKGGFWCYQSDSVNEVYSYIKDLQNIRFARINEMFPNMEVIPIDETKKAKFFEFKNPQKIRVECFEFKVPPIEFEILYKEIILGGQKDLADAKHLRTFFAEILKKEKFKEYEPIVKLELL